MPDKYSGQMSDSLQNNCTTIPISNILADSCNLAVTEKGGKKIHQETTDFPNGLQCIIEYKE